VSLPIDGFDWDGGNRDKCTRHGVPLATIESIFEREVHVLPDIRHSTSETRFLAIGTAPDGRRVFLAFTLRERGGLRLLRPISARWMHAKEVRHLEAQIARTRH
jgi:uncharacterized DUF497 family protein